jgi:alanine racemase
MSKAHLPVRPALRVLSTLCNVKQVPAGVSVGYNGTFTAPRAMTIATIPLGYYEGIDRRLSNVGCVYVRGVKCPIIGRVSMNITTIDISNVSKLREGEVVEVIGIDPKKDNTIVNVAALCHSIPYDILVGINPILHRVVRT